MQEDVWFQIKNRIGIRADAIVSGNNIYPSIVRLSATAFNQLNVPEDEQACAQIGSALGVPSEHIELVDITGVLKNGGGLNCISWNVSLYDSIL